MAETLNRDHHLPSCRRCICPMGIIRDVITSDQSPEAAEHEIKESADESADDEHERLRAALLAGHEDLGGGRGFGERELAVHVLDKELAERDQEQDPEEPAEGRGEEHLEEVGREIRGCTAPGS